MIQADHAPQNNITDSPKTPGYAISCLSWLPLPLTIRAHSWFLLSPHFFRVFRGFRTSVPYFYEMSAHVLASLAKGDQYSDNSGKANHHGHPVGRQVIVTPLSIIENRMDDFLENKTYALK